MTQNEFEDKASMMREKAMLRAKGMGLDNDTAEDIAQDTMLKLWAIHDTLPSDCNIVAFAVTTARNMAIDYLRNNRKAIPIETLRGNAVNTNADDSLERQDFEQWLETKMAKLPPTEHIVLKMRQVEGRNNAEIAALIGITPDSVKTLLSRARKKMLEIIRNKGVRI